jgi:hypothetical protein
MTRYKCQALLWAMFDVGENSVPIQANDDDILEGRPFLRGASMCMGASSPLCGRGCLYENCRFGFAGSNDNDFSWHSPSLEASTYLD